MPWPPTVPPTTVTDATAQLGVHATYHNQLAQAHLDTVTKVGALPLGRVASAQITAGAPTITTTPADVVSVTFTAVAGRRYRLSALVTAGTTTANQAFYAILTDGSNAQMQSTANPRRPTA